MSLLCDGEGLLELCPQRPHAVPLAPRGGGVRNQVIELFGRRAGRKQVAPAPTDSLQSVDYITTSNAPCKLCGGVGLSYDIYGVVFGSPLLAANGVLDRASVLSALHSTPTRSID